MKSHKINVKPMRLNLQDVCIHVDTVNDSASARIKMADFYQQCAGSDPGMFADFSGISVLRYLDFNLFLNKGILSMQLIM